LVAAPLVALLVAPEGLEYNPAYLIAHLNIGRILRGRGQSADAAASLERAMLSCDTAETCGIVRNGLGLVYSDMQEWGKAVANHQEGCRLQPHNSGWKSQLEQVTRAKANANANANADKSGGREEEGGTSASAAAPTDASNGATPRNSGSTDPHRMELIKRGIKAIQARMLDEPDDPAHRRQLVSDPIRHQHPLAQRFR
jgi:tetratricopeptide (TPR) repeat protein